MGGWRGETFWGISSPCAFETNERNRSGHHPVSVIQDCLWGECSLCPDVIPELPLLLRLLYMFKLGHFPRFLYFITLLFVMPPILYRCAPPPTFYDSVHSTVLTSYVSLPALWNVVLYSSFICLPVRLNGHDILCFSVQVIHVSFLHFFYQYFHPAFIMPFFSCFLHPYQFFNISCFTFIH